MPVAHHEDFQRRGIPGPVSDRRFGLTFAILFALIGLVRARAGGALAGWFLAVSGMFLVLAAARPSLLHPLNVVWARLGVWLARLVRPVVTAFLFFGIVTPIALFLRMRGRDALRVKARSNADTYWLPRRPPGPPPESMSRQF